MQGEASNAQPASSLPSSWNVEWGSMLVWLKLCGITILYSLIAAISVLIPTALAQRIGMPEPVPMLIAMFGSCILWIILFFGGIILPASVPLGILRSHGTEGNRKIAINLRTRDELYQMASRIDLIMHFLIPTCFLFCAYSWWLTASWLFNVEFTTGSVIALFVLCFFYLRFRVWLHCQTAAIKPWQCGAVSWADSRAV